MSNLEKIPLVQKLNAATHSQIVNIPEVANRFKQIYSLMNGRDLEKSAIKYEAEKFHFAKLISDKPDLQQCTKLSLYGCFIDMAVNGLSFDPAMKHAYLYAQPVNVGSKDSPKWENRAALFISGYGELVIRMQQKQIKYADNPILVYDGDEFRHGTKAGKVFLEHVAAFPRKSDDIIASYIRIERIDGSVDYKVLGINEIMKFREASKSKNSSAWTTGLPGMVQAKTIKHAFRSFPKVKLGQFTALESERVEPEEETILIDYGLNGSTPEPVTHTEESGIFKPRMIITPADQVEDESFAKQEDKPAEKTMVHDDDNF